MGANEAKTRQLGMPIGTAANRLRKRGHEFNAENTYQSDGRRCRICGDSYRSRREASLTVGTTLEA